MAAVKILKSFLLAGLQTTCFAIYFIDCLSLIVTTHVVRLKLFRLKAEGVRSARLAILWRKQPVLATNIASKCAVFSLFPNSLQPSTYPPE